MKLLSYVRMVLWSFFGIRRSAAAGEELSKANPWVLLGIALALAAAFGIVLLSLARMAVATLTP
jgi:hypothetical protein